MNPHNIQTKHHYKDTLTKLKLVPSVFLLDKGKLSMELDIGNSNLKMCGLGRAMEWASL